MHRVRDFNAVVRVGGTPPVAFLQFGWVRFTASADEADDLARQLQAAAGELRAIGGRRC